MLPSTSDQTNAPEKPPRTITRRRGACRGCKLRKIRCNGGTPCSACDRSGFVCNYEPRHRKTSSSRELDLHASDTPYALDSLDQDRDSSPRSIGSESLGITTGPQHSLLMDNSSIMLSLDTTDFDFLLSPEAVSLPNTSENHRIAHAPLPYDHGAIEGIQSIQHPVFNPTILSSQPVEMGHSEDSRNIDTTHTPSSPYCREDAEIDFRSSTSFGLANLPPLRKDPNKHREICRILHNLTSNGQLWTSPSPIPGADTKNIRSLWIGESDATIQGYIEACFESNAEVPMFIRKADVNKCLSEARETSTETILSLLFGDAIIAMGFDSLRNQVTERRVFSVNGAEYLRLVLDAWFSLHEVRSDLLKLQTVVLLSIIASNINDYRLPEILGMGVQCARDLRYTDSNIIRNTFRNADDRKLAQRTIWVLYCLETNSSLHRGVPPLLHSDFINHLPTTLDHPEKHDPLVLQVGAAGLLARCFSRVYGQSMSAKTTMELQACVSALGQWRRCLSDHVKQLISGQGFDSLHEDKDAAMKLRLFCCYHECVYLLFGPWLPPLLGSMSQALGHDSETPGSIEDHKFVLADALGRCLESAYTIISHANEIVTADKTLARRLRSLMITSVCVITYGVQYGDADMRKMSLAYLGICCGTFSGMYLADGSLPFEEILDLVRIIRSDD
ncbi:hypothetical protein F4805DRAFT_474533 [Annulohypoxylon moriforme]|nr:hypothetical protein F4805DRAFT_474533 [Annulohypoxylon moriforme]